MQRGFLSVETHIYAFNFQINLSSVSANTSHVFLLAGEFLFSENMPIELIFKVELE